MVGCCYANGVQIARGIHVDQLILSLDENPPVKLMGSRDLSPTIVAFESLPNEECVQLAPCPRPLIPDPRASCHVLYLNLMTESHTSLLGLTIRSGTAWHGNS